MGEVLEEILAVSPIPYIGERNAYILIAERLARERGIEWQDEFDKKVKSEAVATTALFRFCVYLGHLAAFSGLYKLAEHSNLF